MATYVNGIDLDELLFDTRPTPLSQNDWGEFLKEEKADENLGFWVDAQKYRQVVKKETGEIKGQRVELQFLKNEPIYSKPVEYAKAIVDKWIGPRATVSEVNISEEMRKALVEQVESGGETPVDFVPYQNEVRSMMLSGERFARFVRRQFTQNISDSEASARFKFGLVTSTIFTTFGVLLRVFIGSNALPRYALAVVLFGLYSLSLYFLLSGYTKT